MKTKSFLKTLQACAVCGLGAFLFNFCHADTLYVASGYHGGNTTIETFDSAGSGTLFANLGLNNPVALAFDSAGNLYESDYSDFSSANGKILKINSSGYSTTFANLLYPTGLAFDSAGNLYSANNADYNILKFNSTGSSTVFATSTPFPPYSLQQPFGIAFDSEGNLYVGNYGNNTIEKFDTLGNGTVFANTGLSGPQGLAFDNAGNLYVSNTNNTIVKFDSSGNGTVFANTGLNNPFGLAFDSGGNLYVANYNGNTIEKFDALGNGTVFASVYQPSGIAFAPAPEPSTWVLLGFGALLALGLGSHGKFSKLYPVVLTKKNKILRFDSLP